jgi:redox-sensitive bicupin YhaK (pirin superfamily)
MHGVARTMKISIVLLVVVTRSSLSFCCAFSTSGAEARWAVKSSLTLHSTTARDRHQFGDNDLTVTTTTKERQPSQRQIVKVEKFARLPVWPVWQGVFLFAASRVFGPEVAAKWEDEIGGRVCPNFFEPSSTDPFVLLVHHRHAFQNWDPIRYIQRTFFPEGFPSHPHRGFITVTYCLKGGFFHRDSLGIKQSYGAEERHNGRHVQWLTTGAGIQHEEMWDVSEPDDKDKGSLLWTSSQELYQIWLNLPSANKMSPPDALLLERFTVNDSSTTSPSPPINSTPIVKSNGGSITTIISGEHDGVRASVKCPTNAAIMRIQLQGTKTQQSMSCWTHNLPSTHTTAILYTRKGAIEIDGQRIPAHHTIFLSPNGEQLTIKASDDADVLLLSGEPLREPIASQGSMVMNTQAEIQKAYSDYQRGYMGLPWDHSLNDDEWNEHVKKNPSMY